MYDIPGAAQYTNLLFEMSSHYFWYHHWSCIFHKKLIKNSSGWGMILGRVMNEKKVKRIERFRSQWHHHGTILNQMNVNHIWLIYPQYNAMGRIMSWIRDIMHETDERTNFGLFKVVDWIIEETFKGDSSPLLARWKVEMCKSSINKWNI